MQTKKVEIDKNIKHTDKVIKALSVIFGKPKMQAPFKIEDVENIALLDKSNICLAISKNEQAKMLLYMFLDSDYTIDKNNRNLNLKLEYKFRTEIKSKYSTLFLRRILRILELSNDKDTIEIQMGTDYPITLSNEHFKFVLAPRVI